MEEFIQAVALYAVLMGVDRPAVEIKDDIPSGRACQALAGQYGEPLIQCAPKRWIFKLSDKRTLAVHELTHLRLYHHYGQGERDHRGRLLLHGPEFQRIMRKYIKPRRRCQA